MPDFVRFYDVSIMNPKVLVGMFMGVMLAFVFCAMTMKAVGRAAGAMVEEVRRQFREIKGIMEEKAEPDYAACVDISTAAAQREMIVPACLGLLVPIAVGLVLGVGGVMGMLAGGLTSGFAVAIMMANAGGAWDNAKKYIETGAHGGKGTNAHKAAVVGDTVGDPFKDTSGPSLNILIKLMSMVSVVFAIARVDRTSFPRSGCGNIGRAWGKPRWSAPPFRRMLAWLTGNSGAPPAQTFTAASLTYLRWIGRGTPEGTTPPTATNGFIDNRPRHTDHRLAFPNAATGSPQPPGRAQGRTCLRRLSWQGNPHPGPDRDHADL
jgi:hypothetical protein